ncbi:MULTISPECIES: amidohydrolase family protein [unclassified Streptomyces]|uniref:amidohydrolase family protein n=1 Tax=unclassified Streptomyces TaxID=2593676 RepID=UPI00278BB4F7|nr:MULTISPECIES: amidohydrolase family protein [unclassified Streptomyces]
MGTRRTVISGGHVISMDRSLGDIPGGAVLIENERIVQVARSAQELAGVDAERIDATGGYVLPGMIDSHRHTWLALLRGISADQALLEFIANTFYRTGAVMGAAEMGTATLVGALEALDAGVTSIFDCSDCVNSPEHADANIEGLRTAGLRSVYAYGMQRYDYEPPGFKRHTDRLADAARVRAEHFSGDDAMHQMGMLYSDFGTIPFHDTAAEIRQAAELDVHGASHTGAAAGSSLLRGLRELHDHGLLREGHLHVHCNGLDEQEWKLLGDSGAHVATSPETELQMGMGLLPIRPAMRNGIAPGIGTDSVICGSGDLFGQLRLALQHQRAMDCLPVHAEGRAPLELDLTVRSALTWATANGARIMGLESAIGSLTPGKLADVIVVKPRWNVVRSSAPAATVVLQSGAADVETVLVNGQVRKRDGQLVGHDLTALRSRANAALDAIERAVAALPEHGPQALAAFVGQAERAATVHYADAYREDVAPTAG